MDILHLVDRLEQIIKKSRRVGNLRMVDERQVWPLLDQMRISVPDEVRRAGRVVRERERALAQAQEEAERVLALARSEAARLTAEHSLIGAAEEQADAIRAQGERDADAIRSGADEYAFDVLCRLEQEMKRALTVIENGIHAIQAEQVRRGSGEAPAERGHTSYEDDGDEDDGGEAAP